MDLCFRCKSKDSLYMNRRYNLIHLRPSQFNGNRNDIWWPNYMNKKENNTTPSEAHFVNMILFYTSMDK